MFNTKSFSSRFFNWQAAAIKEVDPHALVTVGAWNGKVNTDNFGFHNMYKDSCLVKAGGKALVSCKETLNAV